MSEIFEPSRGPDGRFQASTPLPTPAPAADPPVSPAPAAETGEGTAPYSSHRADAKKEWDRLTAEQTRQDGAGTSADAPPATRETPAAAAPENPAQAVADSPKAPDAPPAPPVKEEAKPYAEYSGTLDRKTGDLLKSVNMLVPAEQWKGMSRWEQDELVAACKDLRRQYHQQQNNTRGNPQTSGQTDEPAARGEQPGFSGQQAANASALAGLPQDVQESLAQVATDFGEDSPLYKSQLRLAQHLQNSLQQAQTATQHQLQTRLQQQEAEMNVRRFEDSAFGKYAEAAPSLKDSKVQEELRRHFRATYQTHRNMGHGFTPEEVMEQVILSRVGSEIQQRESERLSKEKEKSLSATIERGTPQATRPQAPNPRNKAKDAYQRLQALQEKGIDGDAALMQLASA